MSAPGPRTLVAREGTALQRHPLSKTGGTRSADQFGSTAFARYVADRRAPASQVSRPKRCASHSSPLDETRTVIDSNPCRLAPLPASCERAVATPRSLTSCQNSATYRTRPELRSLESAKPFLCGALATD